MEGLTTKKGLLEKFQAQTKVLDKVLHAVLLFCAHLMHGRQRSKTWPGRRLSSSELSLQVAGAGLGEAIRVGHPDYLRATQVTGSRMTGSTVSPVRPRPAT